MTSWRDGRTSSERGYGSRWQKARETYLKRNPLCVMCKAMQPPRATPATVVDHKVKAEGDQELFWDSANNWQSLCKWHHDSVKQRFEKSGRVTGCDESGRPLDPKHHWNK